MPSGYHSLSSTPGLQSEHLHTQPPLIGHTTHKSVHHSGQSHDLRTDGWRIVIVTVSCKYSCWQVCLVFYLWLSDYMIDVIYCHEVRLRIGGLEELPGWGRRESREGRQLTCFFFDCFSQKWGGKPRKKRMMETPLYSGRGAGVVGHSIRRRKMTPPIQRQRSFSPTRRRKLTMIGRQRSFDPGESQSLLPPQATNKRSTKSLSINCSPTELSDTAETQFSSRKVSTSKSLTSPRHLRPCTKNRRLELAIDQFTCTALPFYLEVLARHTSKIQKVHCFINFN